jgi:hypothetical protein
MNSEYPVDSHQETLQAREKLSASSDNDTIVDRAAIPEKIICSHCLRTATNGIKCKGICVADSDY